MRLRHFPVLGAVTGFLSALVAATGPLMMPFFLGYGLRRGAFVGTEAVCAAAVHLTKTLVYGRYALVTPETGALGLADGRGHVRRRVRRAPDPRPDERSVASSWRWRSWSRASASSSSSTPHVEGGLPMAIGPGLVGEVELVVQAADTADALGNRGVHVLATPRLVALLELAAIRAVEAHLPPGAGTVGTRIDVRHLAATPVGMRAAHPRHAPRGGRAAARVRHRGAGRGGADRGGHARALPDRPGEVPRPRSPRRPAPRPDGEIDPRRPGGRIGRRRGSVGEDDLVAALALGAVERGVGGPEESAARLPVLRATRPRPSSSERLPAGGRRG